MPDAAANPTVSIPGTDFSTWNDERFTVYYCMHNIITHEIAILLELLYIINASHLNLVYSIKLTSILLAVSTALADGTIKPSSFFSLGTDVEGMSTGVLASIL